MADVIAKLKTSLFSLSALSFLAFTFVLMTGCTHLAAKKQTASCHNLDWFEIGRADGVNGSAASEVETHKRRCQNGPDRVDEDLYANGRNLGLLEYCTPSTGLETGKEGKNYAHVCPEYLEPRFLTGFERGQRISQLEAESSQVETRMERLARMMSRGPAAFDNAGGPPFKNKLEQELNQLRERHAQIDDEISNLESQTL